jgi:ABC-2 type transport system permease protein
MNIINRTFLRLALLPSGIYRKMGANIPQLKAILVTKLTMDDRRPNTFRQISKKKETKPVKAATIGTMFVSAVLGCLYLFAFSIGIDDVTQFTFYFSFFFFMLSATLISDFTSVLIDVRDNYIILPKPISDKTFILARLLHIFIHVCKLVVPTALPGLILVCIKYSVPGGFVFMVMVLLITLFAIFFINAVYILILKITTPQKFQSIISYVQIIFAILVYGSYQILPRMISRIALFEFDISQTKGIVFYPIYWFASAWHLLVAWEGSRMILIAGILGLISPLIGIYVVVKFLAPSFNNKLALITTSSGSEKPADPSDKKKGTKGFYSQLMARLMTRGFAEKMGFLFTWKMTSRSREFRMKVYPSIGYLLVYVVVMFMNNKKLSLEDIREEGTGSKIIVLSALYFSSLLLTMAISQIVYSDKFKAAWIYYTSPLSKPGDVILGAAKAAMFKFYVPIVLFVALSATIIIGPRVLPNIILGLLNELLIATVLVYSGHKYLPFSVHQSNNVKTGGFLRNIGLLMISVLIAIGHFVIYDIPVAVLICAAMSLTATWLMMGSIRNTPWARVKGSYEE